MKKQMFSLSLGVGALLLATQHAFAASTGCADRAVVIERLAERFGETRQSIGIATNNSSVVEVFASLDTGTWTITVTTPNGRTCLVATGEAFETLAEDLRDASESDA